MAQINPADLSAIGELYVPVEHICDGFQEMWDNCPGSAATEQPLRALEQSTLVATGLEPCGPCEPEPHRDSLLPQ